MAKLDVSKMKLDELKALRKDVETMIRDYDRRSRKEALAAAEAAAAKQGFKLADLMGDRPTRKSRGASFAPKYRHPENPSVTWSGRGRRPAWFTSAVAAGTSEEQMLIDRQAR